MSRQETQSASAENLSFFGQSCDCLDCLSPTNTPSPVHGHFHPPPLTIMSGSCGKQQQSDVQSGLLCASLRRSYLFFWPLNYSCSVLLLSLLFPDTDQQYGSKCSLIHQPAIPISDDHWSLCVHQHVFIATNNNRTFFNSRLQTGREQK